LAYLVVEYTGEPLETITTVFNHINNEQIPTCYEFMRSRIHDARILPDGRLFLQTKKSLNAGD